MFTQDLHREALFILVVVRFLSLPACLFVGLLLMCTFVIVSVHFEVSFVEKRLISQGWLFRIHAWLA